MPIALVLAASAILSLSCGQEEEALQPAATETATPFATSAPTVAPATPSPAVNGQLWRWVNVTVFVPEGSPVTIGRGTIPDGLKGVGGPGIDLTIQPAGDPSTASYVIIDAVTGEVVEDHVASEHRTAIDEVVKTLAVSPFDEAQKGWPYADGVPADAERRAEFGISYVLPDPASGIQVEAGIGDPCCPFIRVSNGRSSVMVMLDEGTGTLSRDAVAVSAQDESPFERFLSAVQACGRDVQC